MALKGEILNAIGLETTSTYFDDINDIKIINQGVWEAANTLPKLLLAQAANPLSDPENIPADVVEEGTTTQGYANIYDDANQAGLTNNDIILLVERVVSKNVFDESNALQGNESYETRFVKEVKLSEKHQVLDSDSIYFATNYSPVFWIENKPLSGAASDTTDDEIYIFTAPKTVATYVENGSQNLLASEASALRIYKYSKQAIASDTDTLIGIPTKAHYFVHLYCGMMLVDAVLARQGTEEEDSELFQLLSGVKATIQENLKSQLSQLREGV